MKEHLKEKKIWIENDKAFYKVQDALIANGYRWFSFVTKKITYDEFRIGINGINKNTCVVTFSDGDICCCSLRRKAFDEDYRIEYTIEKVVKKVVTISYKFNEVVPVVRETIEIGEKTYYLDELEVALENIKPIAR